jgi:hypothetical protein
MIIHKGNIGNLLSVESEFKKCDLNEKLITKTQTENMERLIYADKYQDILSYFKANSTNPSLVRMVEKYMKYKFYQNPTAIEKDIVALQPLMDLTPSLTHYQHVQDFVKKLEEQKFVFTEEEKFNEEKFNSELEQYFAMIGEVNNEAIALSKLSGPEEVIMIRKVLGKPYFSLVTAVKNYIPKGVDQAYLDGFKNGMRQITESLVSKGLQVDREKVAFLEKNNYFFEIQKNDIIGVEKNSSLEKALNFHSALLFSNTLDVGTSNKNRAVAGQ